MSVDIHNISLLDTNTIITGYSETDLYPFFNPLISTSIQCLFMDQGSVSM